MSNLTVPTYRPRILRLDSSWQNISWPLTPALVATVRIWITRSRARHEMQELAERSDEHLLEDIGMTREEALRVASKWFWQP